MKSTPKIPKVPSGCCLYCARPADSLEHAIPEAMGGRLQAPILCGEHNGAIGELVDRPLCEWFAPLTNALGIVRQRGTTGTSFRARTVDGTATTRVGPDYSVESPFTIEKDASGRPVRAAGELSAVQNLAKTVGIRPGEKDWQMIQTVVEAPHVSLELGLLDKAHAGLIKIALHFVAIIFHESLSPAVINRCAPIFFAGAPAYDLLSFTILRSPYFIDDDRPHHEVVVFDGGDHATVAIALYGAFRVVVRLDAVSCTRTVRYIQYLDGAQPDMRTSDVVHLRWERIAESDVAGFKTECKARLSEIFRRQAEKYVNECINEALPIALGNYFKWPSTEGLAPHLDAELHTKILDADLRRSVVSEVCAKVPVPPAPSSEQRAS